MAERNLKNMTDNYPVLSCHDLLEYRKKLDQTLPRSGIEKSYLPEERSVQQECLPSVIDGRLNALQEQHVARNRDLVQAEWDPAQKRAFVTKRKGKCMQNAGEIINGKTVLYPEEVLFLMETSILELHFNGAIQSIQEAYRLLLGGEMALEKFQVYSHLRRLGYIVVRHKTRPNDSSEIEPKKQAESTYSKSSRDNRQLREQISQALQKCSKKTEYDINDYVNEKYFRSDDSMEIESKSKTNSRARCLWQGIDIPDIAGKNFLELETPSLRLFPKNVCPQKQHYTIDLQASKNEVEFENDSYYYEQSVCNNDDAAKFSENQTYLTESQTFNNYADYNTGKSEGSNPDQFKNANQDVGHFNQTAGESSQYDIPLANYDNAKLGSYPSNAEQQNQSCNINPHHSQDYVYNVHDNWNNPNKHPGENAHFSGRQTCDKQPSTDNSFNMFYNEAESSQFKNQGHNISHNHSRIPSSSYENTSNSTSYAEHRKQERSGYEMGNLSFNQYEQTYEANRNYVHNSNCTASADPANLAKNLQSESNEESAYTKESSKRHMYKQRYVERRNKSFKKKYTNNNKRRKGRRDASPENSSPFPRISKIVNCWEEFKHEAELQSTAEYLMDGPAKILWNNKITPLVAPSEHLTKETVFGALSIINGADATESCMSQSPPYGKLDFDVYMPTTNYSRYDPGQPSHSIKVVRCKDPTPSMGYEGKIPVHYAMVDNGTIVFYSFRNVKLPCYI